MNSARKVLLLLVGCLVLSSSGYASPLCTTFTTLQNYIGSPAGSGQCELAGLIFYNFSYSDAVTGSAVAVTAANVNVTVDTSVPLTPTLIFTVSANAGGAWTATSTGSIASTHDVRIAYLVTLAAPVTPSSPRIAGAGVGIKGNVSWDYPSSTSKKGQYRALATIGETVTPVSGPGLNPQATIARLDPGPESHGTQALSDPNSWMIVNIPISWFASPQTSASFSKDIYISSGRGRTGYPNTASLAQIDEPLRETIIPEPVTFLMFGSGLIALGALIRKARKWGRD